MTPLTFDPTWAWSVCEILVHFPCSFPNCIIVGSVQSPGSLARRSVDLAHTLLHSPLPLPADSQGWVPDRAFLGLHFSHQSMPLADEILRAT